MKCADPVLCFTVDNKKKYRHFSLCSKIMLHLPHLVFDCGKCLHCRKKKAFELATRCVLHASLYQQNCFLTLTYDEKKETYHNVFDYSDIQKFKKRFRQKVWRDYKQRIEIFNVHEYGRNGKKHWHLICFNYDFVDKTLFTMSSNLPLYTSKLLQSLWPFGFSTIGDVSEASAMYQSQYMEKDFKNRNNNNKLYRSHSKHSGIAKPYFLLHYKQLLSLGYVPIGGRKLPLPRYFQKLAHKHWAHFNDTSYFFDTPDRKQVYRPFKLGEENKEISDLYAIYKATKDSRLPELEKEWNDVISQYLTDSDSPDFIKSNENKLYDLRNKNNLERF